MDRDSNVIKGRNGYFMRLSRKLNRMLTMCLALALIVCGVTVMPAFAGKAGGYVVDESKLSTESLSLAEWRFEEVGVTLKDGALVFDEYYDLDNPVLSRTAAYSSEEVMQALEVCYVLSVDEIKGNKQFGFGFGIARLNCDITEGGSTFLYAQETEKGIGFGLSTVKNGEVVDLKELTHYGSKAKNVNIIVRVTNEGAVTVLLGSTVFYAGQPGEVTADGYLGFSSSGDWSNNDCYVKASVKNFTVYNEYYAKPETPLVIVADFDNDEFNINEWAINSTEVAYGSGIIAKDGALRFEGAGQNSAIAAQFKYSNFEIQYDIFDMKNTLSANGDGFPITPSMWTQLAWGTEADSAFAAASYYGTNYALVFHPSVDEDPNSPTYLQRPAGSAMSVHFFSPKGWEGAYELPEKYDFSRPGFDPETKVQIRLASVDGTATLYMKLATEKDWTEIWTYRYADGIMPVGYVVLRGEGNQFTASRNTYAYGSWYSIDNILLTNYDENPTLTTVTFETNRIPPVPDLIYKDPYVDSYLVRYTGGKP